MPSFLLTLLHSTPSNPQLCTAICHWPLPCAIFIPPLVLHVTARAAPLLGNDHRTSSSRNLGRNRSSSVQTWSLQRGSAQARCSWQALSVTGCSITGAEMQDVKLSWQWLKRCFHHIIESVLFMPFKSCFLLGYCYDPSPLLLCPHPLIKQNNQDSQRVSCARKAYPAIMLILQTFFCEEVIFFLQKIGFWGKKNENCSR